MSRSADERIDDILAAIDRCTVYREHLSGSNEEIARMAYDAVLRNLAVVGEAARALRTATRNASPRVPWAAVMGLRNIIVHEYFRVRRDLVLDIIDSELRPLAEALRARER